jgi:outer membrane protein assembly factor BamD (BamD/ComL family)
MDSAGVERDRLEGYLPKNWFRARLEMGIARVALMHKKFAEAQKLYEGIVDRYGKLTLAAEAMYWSAVSKYKATNDHTALGEVTPELAEQFPGNEWQLKSLPWAH